VRTSNPTLIILFVFGVRFANMLSIMNFPLVMSTMQWPYFHIKSTSGLYDAMRHTLYLMPFLVEGIIVDGRVL
jgi:hypothetical protein